MEMCCVFTFALSQQCVGNTRDLCHIGKKGSAMKTQQTAGGKLLADCPLSVWVIAGLCQSSSYSAGLGGLITND